MSTTPRSTPIRHNEYVPDPSPTAGHLQTEVRDAVRDAAIRAAVAVGLGGIVVIHAIDAVNRWSETRYIFWLYMALIVSAIVVGAWTLASRSRASLLAAGGLAASVLAGYIVNRSVGLPNATGDIGNWVEPVGLSSMVVEGMVILAALGGARLAGQPAAPAS